ncbi:MAG: hypothetical protein R2755_24930 [Acidimicrobiales bacterium]
MNKAIKKGDMTALVDDFAARFGNAEVSKSLDAIKDLCFKFATCSGLTISVDDIKVPGDKNAILDRYEGEAEKVETQFRRGIITDGERRQKEVEIWTYATEEIMEAMEAVMRAEVFNPVDMMVGSGAQGTGCRCVRSPACAA